MSQQSMNMSATRRQRFGRGRRNHSALNLEKAGVITGFIVGLALGTGLVSVPLAESGVPETIAFAAAVLVIALSTWAGQRLSVHVAAWLARQNQG